MAGQMNKWTTYGNCTICNNRDKLYGYYAKQNKPEIIVSVIWKNINKLLTEAKILLVKWYKFKIERRRNSGNLMHNMETIVNNTAWIYLKLDKVIDFKYFYHSYTKKQWVTMSVIEYDGDCNCEHFTMYTYIKTSHCIFYIDFICKLCLIWGK